MREIVFQDGTAFPEAAPVRGAEPAFLERRGTLGGVPRELLCLTFLGTHEAADAHFRDDTAWGIRESAPGGESVFYDRSDFALAGDLTDHRDGRLTVVMARRTAAEQQVRALQAELLALRGEEAAARD